MSANFQFVMQLITLAFGAGVAWFAIKQAQKDVNGIGRKVNSLEFRANRRNLRICMILVAMAKDDETRYKLIGLLEDQE